MPAILVGYYHELVRIELRKDFTELFDKLENLPNLPKEELEEIAERIKKRRHKI